MLVFQRNEASYHLDFEDGLKLSVALWPDNFPNPVGLPCPSRSFVEGMFFWELTATFLNCFNAQETGCTSDISAQIYATGVCVQDALCLNRRPFEIGTIWCFPCFIFYA